MENYVYFLLFIPFLIVFGALEFAGYQSTLDRLDPVLKQQNLTRKSLTKCFLNRGPFLWTFLSRSARVYYLTATTPDGSTRHAYICNHRILDIHWITD